MEITEAMIDAGANHLWETHGAGKVLTPWDRTPNATKKKWLALSKGTLLAALTDRIVHMQQCPGGSPGIASTKAVAGQV